MRRSTLVLPLLALLASACGEEPLTPSNALEPGAPASARADASLVATGLAEVRRATSRFHRFDVALDAEYTFLFNGMCMEAPSGGMGYHYVNLGLLDGEVNVTEPEALLYEPGPNHQMRLVAVEYVIPKDAWAGPGVPTLLGQELTLNSFDLYALHAWVWKDNPDGMFASWNPSVSCAGAAPMASH